MSMLNDLVNQIEDKTLRDRIAAEVDRLAKQKKFGLVFEEHLPECTPLYDIPVRNGSLVMVKGGDIKDLYYVKSMADGKADCVKRDGSEYATFGVDDVVPVAEFGDPIYPYLKPIDSICNAPDCDLWHTLIEADNYHALQLLEYLYAGKVDCIYIDPPYNTGAKDWKYNNDYVDGNDAYRHSKWLSMMQKRLKIAKRLLNPNDSVMIVTIDEKEYLHLGCLLEEMFPEAKMQMISSVISRKSSARSNEFARNNEYIYFVRMGDSKIIPIRDTDYLEEGAEIHWQTLRRSNATNIRDEQHPNQFYPIYVDIKTDRIVKIGKSLPMSTHISQVESIPGCETVFPIRDDGTEMMWGIGQDLFSEYLPKGYVRATKHTPDKPQKYVIQYLMKGTVKEIENGTINITGINEQGFITGTYETVKKVLPETQWNYDSHDARDFGTYVCQAMMPDRTFPYPKSIYAVEDCLRMFIENKPNALVVDFFSGSGTTANAVMLLNHLDGGHRRSISVTNNELSESEAAKLSEKGHKPGDVEWEKYGIAKYITFPRIKAAITGKDTLGNPINGTYKFSEEFPMSDGFETNAVYFKLGFLDKNMVALGRQFKELIPILWMKAGAKNKCPELTGDTIPSMMILPENQFAVLVDEKDYLEFITELDKHPEIKTVYIVTDSEAGFRDMINGLEDKDTYQLYRDYLDNFRINSVRR